MQAFGVQKDFNARSYIVFSMLYSNDTLRMLYFKGYSSYVILHTIYCVCYTLYIILLVICIIDASFIIDLNCFWYYIIINKVIWLCF